MNTYRTNRSEKSAEYAPMIHLRQTGADADIVVLTESASTF
jgi:hypothetical protein